MAGIDICQHGGMLVVICPKQTCVAIVSEAPGELLIECLNEMGGGAVNSVAEVCPRDRLQVRHHESRRNSFAAYVGTEDPNSFLAEIEEIVQIAADHPRRQRSG